MNAGLNYYLTKFELNVLNLSIFNGITSKIFDSNLDIMKQKFQIHRLSLC